CSTTPCSIITIDHTPIGSPGPAPPSSSPTPPPSHPLPPLHSNPGSLPSAPKNPNASSPPVQRPSHSHDGARQEFTDLRLTLMVPQALVHQSIN
ncbi:hypothetical protein O181_113238, partial [Austropuccinia psidii MF-1]|nr:hypothetical protein [Austropuccinia psidii MF-1]